MTIPEYKKEKFKCPNCGVVAMQEWMDGEYLINLIEELQNQFFLDYRKSLQSYAEQYIKDFLISFYTKQFNIKDYFPQELSVSSCHSCSKTAIWIREKMVFPKITLVDGPNEDLSSDIKDIYAEAARIVNDSPKGAAALLRLALQKVLIQVGEDGQNINNNIKNLVGKGLSPSIQQALDLLRVVGNHAVHPGQISLDDNREIALKMFKLINLIAKEMITSPREIKELYEEIVPENTKKQIEERDKK